ncbi:MAG: putative diguanylate phosphodiesterase [Phycisphaerales bacterium]|nr:putative diguanylate phosphodiesterase [Phycisphaerales bacterium]
MRHVFTRPLHLPIKTRELRASNKQPMRTADSQALPPDVPVDCLLFSAQHSSVRGHLASVLTTAGAQVEVCDPGLKMHCRDVDWKPLVQSAAQSLSHPERRDIRIAPVPAGEGADTLHTAIFNVRRLEEFLQQLAAEWLTDVLKRDAVAIHFQPLVQFPPGRIHGYECFARGVAPDGQLIEPQKMFEAARALDLLPLLDHKCRAAAIARAADLGMHHVQLFINFTPAAIYSPQFCFDETLAAVQAAGLQPANITFEATNYDHVADQNHLNDVLHFLRAQGFKIALDGVGPGRAALPALADLRPDYLKLDGDFVRRAAKFSPEARVARDLAEAARQHGVITVATGIESEQQLKFARSAGIRVTQGNFHISPAPEPPTPEQSAQALQRVKETCTLTASATAPVAPGTPWDISGLYATLASSARQSAPPAPKR